ncbi:MAG TPA: hypothetical protein VFU11_13255 [Solirubrobacterales bacterium]|nr:hypothetical protein [Solirubrobacterales bacterium]
MFVLPKSLRTRADLSEKKDFFLDLLSDPELWKQRVISEFSFEAANHVTVASSFQIEFPPDLIQQYVDTRFTRRANILLPVTIQPKDALLNFNLSGPAGTPATLVPRVSIAGLQADYLQGLAASSPANLKPLDHSIYDAISVFTPFTFRTQFLQQRSFGRWVEKPFEEALQLYLSDGLGLPIQRSDVLRWRTKTQKVGALLAHHLDEPPEKLSSSEEVLLAIPLIEPPISSISSIDLIVDQYADQIEKANAAGDAPYLSVLAEYGRRYELICEVEVPLLEPFRIKVEEDRPLGLRGRGSTTHSIVIGGSRSIHIEARTADSNVILGKKMTLCDAQGRDISGLMELIRLTPESAALYSSESNRPYIANLSLRLAVAFQLTVAAFLLTVISIVAAIAALSLDENRFLVGGLGVLAVPTTVASAFVLAREDSPLATRLQRYLRTGLVVATLALWSVVVGRLVSYDPPVDKPSSAAAQSVKVVEAKGASDGKKRTERQRTSGGGEGTQSEP